MNNPETNSKLWVSNSVPGMRKPSLALIIVLATPALRAQEALPRHYGDWTASGPVLKAPAPVHSNDQQQAILIESGIVSTNSRAYTSGPNTGQLAVSQFRDSSGAYEAFTFLRSSDMVPDDVSPEAAVGRDRALLQYGNLVLEINGLAAMSPADLQTLSKWLAGAAQKTPLPPIRNFLPQRHLIPGSERYILGPLAFRSATETADRGAYSQLADELGFRAGAEAILARYRKGKDDGVLLLVEYPTPQLAAQRQKHIEQGLASTPQPSETAIRRKGSLLSLVLQPASHEYAEALLDDVRYETQVTWNEPSHEVTDPPWSIVIVNTILGTGVFLVAAFVFGIAFGGIRVMTKIFLPGKVFDRAERHRPSPGAPRPCSSGGSARRRFRRGNRNRRPSCNKAPARHPRPGSRECCGNRQRAPPRPLTNRISLSSASPGSSDMQNCASLAYAPPRHNRKIG